MNFFSHSSNTQPYTHKRKTFESERLGGGKTSKERSLSWNLIRENYDYKVVIRLKIEMNEGFLSFASLFFSGIMQIHMFYLLLIPYKVSIRRERFITQD
jgi:hypothetical protein